MRGIGGIGVGLSVGQWRKPTLTARVLPIITKTKNSINLQTLASFYLKLIWYAQKKTLKGEMNKMESKK